MPLHVSSTVLETEIKLIMKQILCIKLVKYADKCTEMHGQQNVKIYTTLSLNAVSKLYALS